MRQCEIYLHGIKCGLLTEEDDKSFTFSYDCVYLQRADADPVSPWFSDSGAVSRRPVGRNRP